MVLLRPAAADDLDAVLAVQEPGAVRALATVFPQHTHPFPRSAIRARHQQELDDPAVEWFVACDSDSAVRGFAATTGTELLHFGVDVSVWGTGFAAATLVATIATMPGGPLRLRVFEGNVRARRARDLPT